MRRAGARMRATPQAKKGHVNTSKSPRKTEKLALPVAEVIAFDLSTQTAGQPFHYLHPSHVPNDEKLASCFFVTDLFAPAGRNPPGILRCIALVRTLFASHANEQTNLAHARLLERAPHDAIRDTPCPDPAG